MVSAKPINYSQTWTYFEGDWHEGNAPIMGPRTHAAWLGSTVFDGARAFDGTAPDLDRHCARVNQSATNLKLKPVVDLDTWLGLAREGIARFAPRAELYIRPMYWAQHGAGGEGGTTPALGVVVNAVVDALAEYGVTHIEMPVTAEKVWRAIRDGKAARH